MFSSSHTGTGQVRISLHVSLPAALTGLGTSRETGRVNWWVAEETTSVSVGCWVACWGFSCISLVKCWLPRFAQRRAICWKCAGDVWVVLGHFWAWKRGGQSPQELNQAGCLLSSCRVSRSAPLLPCPAPKSSSDSVWQTSTSFLLPQILAAARKELPPLSYPTFSIFLPKETHPGS